MTVYSYRDLDVWKRSVEYVIVIYNLTKKFPKDEIYSLTNQIRRAAVSIPSNIAEGRSKKTTRDFIRFINISYGSLAELETQLIIAQKLGYMSNEELKGNLEEAKNIGCMLNGLLSGLEKRLAAA